jgi:hypothetical protein
MRILALAVLLGLMGLTLGACAEVEGLYEMGCTDMGGTWSSADGCKKDIFAS